MSTTLTNKPTIKLVLNKTGKKVLCSEKKNIIKFLSWLFGIFRYQAGKKKKKKKKENF